MSVRRFFTSMMAVLNSCQQDTFTCDDGTQLKRDPDADCGFPSCPVAAVQEQTCPTDTMMCSSTGLMVMRDPALDCEFPLCPAAICTMDTHTCADGSVRSRNPANDCDFFACRSTATTVGDYFLLAAATDGCLGRPPVTAGDALLLVECDESNPNAVWRMDPDGKFRSRANDEECIQAGQRPELLEGVDDGLVSGSTLYIKGCNGSLRQPFQEFDDMWVMEGMNGPLTLEERPDLCVVPFGDTPDVGNDRILLVECSTLGTEGRGAGWTAIYPNIEYDYVTLEASAGGCMARKAKGMGGDELFLKSCTSNDDNIQWRLDDQNRLHSKANDAECVQAGEAPSLFVGPGALTQGTDVFVKACDGPRKPDFQNLAFPSTFSTDPEGGSYTAVTTLESRPDLCVMHFAAEPTIDESRIMLIECDSLAGGRALGWTFANPCTHLPGCEP